MKEYSIEQIITKFHENPDWNILAVATTPWHALGVDAALYHLQQQGIALKGYIVIRPHQVTGFGLTEDNFVMRDAGELEVIYMSLEHERRTFKEKLINKYNKFKYYHSNLKDRAGKDRLYWIRPMSPEYDVLPILDSKDYQHNVQMILTDEGLGTYLNSNWIWVKLAFKEGGLKQGIRSFITNFIANKIDEKRILTREQVQYYQLLVRKNDKWIPNKDAIYSYREILRQQGDIGDYHYYSDSVILNTGPYETIIKDNADVRLLEKICRLIYKIDMPIILKPHPREKELEKYDTLRCKIENTNGVAQESILATIEKKPYCIVGFDSTTLISAKLLFEINAISVNKLLDKDTLYNKDRYAIFNKIFGNLICIPETMQELESEIQRIKKEFEDNK